MMCMVLVLNGFNLNLFGICELQIYGWWILGEIVDECVVFVEMCGFVVDFCQINQEG